MKITRRIATSVVTVACALTGATAAHALPAWVPVLELPYPGQVIGGERDIVDRAVSRTTADGWVLNVQKLDEAINFAPALDGGITTGEGFGTLTGNSWISGEGLEPLKSAYFETGYQIGCGVDISDGVAVETTAGASVSPSVGVAPSVGVSGGPSAEVTLPSGEGTIGAEASANAGVEGNAGVDANAETSSTVSYQLNPGGVTNITLAGYDMNLEKLRAAGGFTGAHLQINGCVGPVYIRSYVSLATTTDTSVDYVAVYGDARRIR
ncbi:MAG: MspA family porin [Corynebacterium sp.]|nr:MspA family porin [Corynebacterium sp.]